MAAPAAATAASLAAQQAANQGQAIIHELVQALNRPIYQDVQTHTWTNPKTGVVTTRTKGYTVTVGLLLGALFIFAMWEIANWFAQAFNKSSNPIVDVSELLGWAVGGPATAILAGDLAQSLQASAANGKVPSLMASLQVVGVGLISPIGGLIFGLLEQTRQGQAATNAVDNALFNRATGHDVSGSSGLGGAASQAGQAGGTLRGWFRQGSGGG